MVDNNWYQLSLRKEERFLCILNPDNDKFICRYGSYRNILNKNKNLKIHLNRTQKRCGKQ